MARLTLGDRIACAFLGEVFGAMYGALLIGGLLHFVLGVGTGITIRVVWYVNGSWA